MKDKIIVVGSSGHACVVIELLEQLDYEIIGCIDSFAPIGKKVMNYKVLGDEEILTNISKFGTHKLCIAVGNNYNRKLLYTRIKAINSSIIFPTIISKYSKVSPSAVFGKGNVVMDNVIIHSNTLIGDFNLLNTSCIIEHDCTLDDFISISPNSTLCGNVTIGENSFIGANAVVIQKLKISESVVIAAGSVVVSDCTSNTLVGGNPAKVIKEKYDKTNYL